MISTSTGRKRIAIDCRALVRTRAGIGRYLYRLLEELALRSDDHEYYLYAPGAVELPPACLADERFTVRVRRFRIAILWLHAVVPFWIKRDQIDVFFGPNYATPIVSLHPHRRVITIHDMVYARFPETMLWKTRLHNRLMIPVYAAVSDLVITDSHFSAKELIEITSLTEHKLRVIHLGADERRAGQPFRAEMRTSQYLLAVGTVEPRKNLERLTRAYASLSDALRAQYKLVIVGRSLWGGLNPTSWFQQQGLIGQAIFLDDVGDEELLTIYEHAALFVYPSLYEGFGLPIVEAMAHGVPVLCSYTSSLYEVADGAAIFCNPLSVPDIAAKIGIILEDTDLQLKLARLGRERAQELTWDKTAQQTLQAVLGDDH